MTEDVNQLADLITTDMAQPPEREVSTADLEASAVMQEPASIYEGLSDRDRDEIEEAANRIRLRLKRTLEDCILIGKELLKVKERLPKGAFGAWVAHEFNLSERHAQHLMRVGLRFGDQPEKISGLQLSVLYALAAPSTPDEVVDIVIDRHEAGEQVNKDDVEHLKRHVREVERKLQEAESATETVREELAQMYLRELKEKEEKLRELEQHYGSLESKLADLEHLSSDVVTVAVETVPEGYATVQDAIDDLQVKLDALNQEKDAVEDALQLQKAQLDDALAEVQHRQKCQATITSIIDGVKGLITLFDHAQRVMMSKQAVGPIANDLTYLVTDLETLRLEAEQMIKSITLATTVAIDVSSAPA